METVPHVIPAVAIKSIASGMLMMACFTLMWTGIAFGGGLIGTIYQWGLVIFPILAILFVVKAISFFNSAKYFPKLSSEADIAEGKNMGMWFGIIFGAEGLLIFVGINIVLNLGHPDLVIPTIALVVGLHFFPLAKVFKRTIDYYLATWATLIALCGFFFTLNKTMPVNHITAFVGIGIAIATSCYGIYMIYAGNEILKKKPVAV